MMDLKNLFTDDDAVSPVIGVILMVAITVILAAVIGAFVLNIGGNQEAAPQAQFDFSYTSGDVAVTHGGGGSVEFSQLELTGGNWGTNCSLASTSGTASAGDDIVSTCTPSGGSGDTLTITWTASSGDTSQIIAESTIP